MTQELKAPFPTRLGWITALMLTVAVSAVVAMPWFMGGCERDASANTRVQSHSEPSREKLTERAASSREAMNDREREFSVSLRATRHLARDQAWYGIRFWLKWYNSTHWVELAEMDCRSLLQFFKSHQQTSKSKEDAVGMTSLLWEAGGANGLQTRKGLVSGTWTFTNVANTQWWGTISDSTNFERALEQALSDLDALKNATPSHKPTL